MTKPKTIATVIRLTPDEYHWLTSLASTWQLSMSETLRRIIDSARQTAEKQKGEK